MPIVHNLLELSAFKAIYRLFGLGLLLFFLADVWFATQRFAWMDEADTIADYANGFALGLGALLSIVIAQQHPLTSIARIFWWAIGIGLGFVAAMEVFDILGRMDRAWADEDYADLVILGLTPIGLYIACVIENAPRIAISAMKFGFLFQCISDLIDLGDGDLYDIVVFDHNLMEVLTDISELIFIETYLFGLGCLLLSIVARRLIPGGVQSVTATDEK